MTSYCNVLCLGDPEVIGDAVGPIVGSELLRRGSYTAVGTVAHPKYEQVFKAKIVGTLDSPVLRSNYEERIKELLPDIPTIVVDAHIAKMGPLFYYSFIKGTTLPGILHGSCINPIGDFAMRCWTARTPQELLTADAAVIHRLARDMTTALLDLISNQQLKTYI
ncbi:hypothetical protein D3C71_235090 [compost metagenome]